MRGLPGFLLAVLAALAILAFVIVPIVVRPLVAGAVRTAAGFEGDSLGVDVELNVVGLALGSIDAIHLAGQDLRTRDGLAIGAMDVDLSGVRTDDQTFRGVEGTLTNVEVPWSDGSTIRVDVVELSGPSDAVNATLRLGFQAGVDFVGNTLLEAGMSFEGIGLTDGGLTVTILGQQGFLLLGVDEGAIVIPDLLGGGPFTIVEPGIDDGWRATGVVVTPEGISIDVVFDATTVQEAR